MTPVGSFERLVLKNVRCFRDATVELHPQMTVLLGENGAGKTTVIEALSSLAYGDGEGLAVFPLARKAKSGEIALHRGGEKQPAARWNVSGTSGARQRLAIDQFFLAYGRYRRVFYPEEEGAEAPRYDPSSDLAALASRANENKTVTVFRPDSHLLRDLSRYLVALHQARTIDSRIEATWKRLETSLGEIGQGLTGIVMDSGKWGNVPKVMRQGLALELKELSDGYQAILVVILDLILRYVYLFPSLAMPLDGSATVAVDEVDLHLHPRWQRTVAGQLTTLFPNTQFILTTHSPAVVQGAIDRGSQVISLQEEKGAATVQALDERTRKKLVGAEIGSVLQAEPLFSVGSRYSPEFSRVEERITQIQKKVARGTAGEGEMRELFACMNILQRLITEDEKRRGDGGFLSQMTELRKALLEDLAAEIARLKS